jgi:hypothetical protein
MARSRERLCSGLARIATRPTEFFRIPPDRVVELGAEVEIGPGPAQIRRRPKRSVLASPSISRPARLSQDRCLRRNAKFSAVASRDSAYPAQGSTHSRRVQGAHLALAARRGNRATRGGASAARNCVRGIALPGWPRAGAANRPSPLIGRYPARIVARSILASGRHDEGFLYE